jgi:glucose/arabinose dehydrogenase
MKNMARIGTAAAVIFTGATAFAAGVEDVNGVLKGAAALGSWQQDRPGVRRLLTPQDLPPIGASTPNFSQVVPMPAGAKPQVPEGFTVEMVASGLANPRAIRLAPNGDLFVADSMSNSVYILRVPAGSATPAKKEVFADGLYQPFGIAFYPLGPNPEWIYIANSDGVVRFPYRSGGSGSNVALDMFPEPLTKGGLQAWVQNHPLGATWDTEERRADVLSYDPNGKNEKILATGLRNCSGMTFQPATGHLWCVVNERDELGDNTPFEYATAVAEGAFYGWPWYYIGSNKDPRHKAARPDLEGKVTVPDVLMQAHSAPLQIAFYDAADFPANYKGSAFVTLHGSWNRAQRTGYKVVRLLFDSAGKATGEYEDFMTGFVVSDTEVWGRPVGVAVARDGSLFVTEDGNGTIWRVTYRQPASR